MQAKVAYLDPFLYPFQQIHTRFEAEYGIMWYHMDPKPRPCFNPELLKELKKFVDSLAHIHKRASEQEQNGALRYTVFASRHPGVFSLGGDLELLLGLVKARDGEGLRRYAKACIDVVYSGMVNHEVPVTTISLVQGDAMGGGFEAAMCNNVIIAEKSASFGFPEEKPLPVCSPGEAPDPSGFLRGTDRNLAHLGGRCDAARGAGHPSYGTAPESAGQDGRHADCPGRGGSG